MLAKSVCLFPEREETKKYVVCNDSFIHLRQGCNQCDQHGLLIKGLGYKFSYKSSPNIEHLFGQFQKKKSKVKSPVADFWATFYIKFGYSLIQHMVTLDAILPRTSGKSYKSSTIKIFTYRRLYSSDYSQYERFTIVNYNSSVFIQAIFH